MKKLFYFAFAAAFAFTACSKDDDCENPTVCPPSPGYELISFEKEEMMTDCNDKAALPGDVTLVGGVSDGSYENVLCGLSYAEEEGVMGLTFDAPLFSTAVGNVWFGSFYCDGTGWGSGRMDMWFGIVLSKNCNITATKMDYKDQFSVWADKGANDSETFAACYDGTMFGGAYSTPTIVFTKPRIVESLCLANSTMVGTYKSSKANYTFSVLITGLLNGQQVGTHVQELVSGDSPLKGWINVDLKKLGKVDNLKFTVISNDAMAPTYFCLDEIVLNYLGK